MQKQPLFPASSPLRKAPTAVSAYMHGLTFSLPITFLLLIGSIKGTEGIYIDSGYNIGYIHSPFMQLVKDRLVFIFVLTAALFLFAIARNRTVQVRLTFVVAIQIALYLWGAVVTSFEGASLALKMTMTATIFAIMQIYLSSLLATGRDVVRLVSEAMLLFSGILIGLNTLEFLLGGGYSLYSPRYFGTSDHPNFLGVQMAICSLIFVTQFRSTNKTVLCTKLILLILGLTLLYLSGSRTGVVVFIVGYLAFFSLTRRLPAVAVAALIGATATAIVFVYGALGAELNLEVYDRGGADTRSEAWQYLWGNVMEAPIVGHGYLPEKSENSLLRGWSTIGIIYPIVYIFTIGYMLAVTIFFYKTKGYARCATSISIFFGVAAGSVLEGYLIDVSSLPAYTWFLSILIVSLDLSARARVRKSRVFSDHARS